MKRVFFHVQHLLGIGHLKRAAAITRALRAAGLEVTLASGGLPVDGIEVLQLPPVSSPDFKTLLDQHGRPVDDAWKARRRDALLAAFQDHGALIVELFPFGRRQMRFELISLLEKAKSSLVVCSVRDLLQPNPAKEAEALERFDDYFNHVLVHGEARVDPGAGNVASLLIQATHGRAHPFRAHGDHVDRVRKRFADAVEVGGEEAVG